MTITPDNLAARFAPPMTGGDSYWRQVVFLDGARELAEHVLDVLPRGHHQDQAVLALETAAHWVGAGLAAADLQTPADGGQNAGPAPYPLTHTPPPGRPAQAAASLDLPVGLWTTGIRSARGLHPLARLVALTVVEAADDQGLIAEDDQPVLVALSEGTGLGPCDVLRALEDLVAAGWLARHTPRTGPPTTTYQLRMPPPTSQQIGPTTS